MEHLGQLALIATIVALEPLPILVFVLTLISGRGAVAGWAFLAGWAVSMAAVVVVASVIGGTGGLRLHSSPSLVVLWIELVIGAALLVVGTYRVRHPRQFERSSRLFNRLERLSLPWAFVAGVLVQPWPLLGAGSVQIARLRVSGLLGLVALVVFCLWSSAVLLALEGYAVLKANTAQVRLVGLRHWLEAHQGLAVAWIAVGAGLYLVVSAALGIAK